MSRWIILSPDRQIDIDDLGGTEEHACEQAQMLAYANPNTDIVVYEAVSSYRVSCEINELRKTDDKPLEEPKDPPLISIEKTCATCLYDKKGVVDKPCVECVYCDGFSHWVPKLLCKTCIHKFQDAGDRPCSSCYSGENWEEG